jgi:hypothetical protein
MINKLLYVVNEMREHYDDRRWWEGRIRERIIHPVHSNVYPGYDGSVRIMEEDWDVLIVLDACRADMFEDATDDWAFDEYDVKTSQGSSTPEWTRRNFAGGSFGDTVYVAANPYTSMLAGDAFHDVIEVWREDFDEDELTVMAESVVEAAREAREEYPDKRLIVHFMQPHFPFVTSDELTYSGWHPDRIAGKTERTEPISDPWHALQKGLVDYETVWSAYESNLDYVLDHTAELTSTFEGRIVITSDHGNMVGWGWPVPMKIYGHAEGLRYPGLVEVPWAVIERGERPTITSDTVRSITTGSDAEVEDRLESLGYVV